MKSMKMEDYVIYFILWVFLCSLSYSMFDFPFIWIAFVPLICGIYCCPVDKLAKLGFIFSALYYITTLYWLIAFHEISIGFVFPIYGLYGASIVLLTRYLTNCLPKFRILIFPLIWISFEFIRSSGFLGFRWNLPIDALWKQLIFMQSADVIGSWGVSFLILLCNSCIAEFILIYREEKDIKSIFIKYPIHFYIILFLFLGNLSYGFSSMRVWSHMIDTKLAKEKIGLIQANKPGYGSWEKNKDTLTKEYIKLMTNAKSDGPDMILQTEVMLPYSLWFNVEQFGLDHPYNIYSKKFIELSKTLGIPIILTHIDSEKNNYYNAASLVSYPDGINWTKITYRKIHIVPFGEWIPGIQSIKWTWLNNIINELGAGGIAPGDDFIVFTSQKGIQFSELICFEDVFPILGRHFVKKGAQYFVNSTNDGWAYRWKLGSKTPLWQHLANTIQTSIALRRSIARSVNTGISAVIDPMGRVSVSPIKEYTPGYYVDEVPIMPKNHLTHYVKWGYMIGYIFFFLTIILILYCLLWVDKKGKILAHTFL